MFKEQIKENLFSSKRQHDKFMYNKMSQCADNEINVAERQALCAIFMALSKAKQWNPVFMNVKAIGFNARLNN